MCKQINPYTVQILVLQSGERLPLLSSRDTGLPLFEPTLYSITELRAKGLSTATIQQALRSVMLMQLVLDQMECDLNQRLLVGRLLEMGEIEEVVRYCRLKMEEIVDEDSIDAMPVKPTVVSIEKARMRFASPHRQEEVSSATTAIRIRYIRDYLKWRTTDRLLKLAPKDAIYTSLKTASDLVLRAFDARTPSSSGRNTVNQREGLSPESLARLLQVIEPTSPDNISKGVHVRERNALIIKWFLSLGVRRGELLSIRISDINFQRNEVLVARRADNPEDPRQAQPNTKTKDRLLAMDGDLAELTRRYIMGPRHAIKSARKHDYLFVANGSGAPLTLSSVNKMFTSLRHKIPDLPDELVPHVCRYTWNDRFSEVMDKQQVPEEKEKKMRSRLMGWSETSNSAAVYTRRHIQRKAREASLDLQRELNKGDQDET